MNIELQEKKVVDLIRDNLDIFKKVEDKDVKKAISEIESAISEYDTAIENVSEPAKPVVEEVKEEPVKEDKPVEPIKEEPVEKPVVEKKTVEPIVQKVEAADVQLSMEVANKLKEAAIELELKDKTISDKQIELSAKNEIIDGYKSKVVELTSSISSFKIELSSYKKKEELALHNQKQTLVNDLIELYANLNIVKTNEEIHSFNLSQLVELRKALEVTLDKKNTPVRETSNSSTVKAVKQHKKEDFDSKDTFEGLFGRNPDMY